MQLRYLLVKITCHDPFAEQFETAHFGFDQAAPVVTAPFLPNGTPEQSGCSQYIVPYIGVKVRLFARFGIFPGRDNGLRMAQRDGLVAGFRIVGTIAADSGDVLVFRYLPEQFRPHRHIANAAVRDLDGPDFQRCCINPQVCVASLAPEIGTVFLGFPFTLAQHLDASAVDQQVQAGRDWSGF